MPAGLDMDPATQDFVAACGGQLRMVGAPEAFRVNNIRRPSGDSYTP